MLVIGSFFLLPQIEKLQHPATGVYYVFPIPLMIASELSHDFVSSYTTFVDELAMPYQPVVIALRNMRSWELLFGGITLSMLASIIGMLSRDTRAAALLIIVGQCFTTAFHVLDKSQSNLQIGFFLSVVGSLLFLIESFDSSDVWEEEPVAEPAKLKAD